MGTKESFLNVKGKKISYENLHCEVSSPGCLSKILDKCKGGG